MAAVHLPCYLCIHLATRIREKEEKSLTFKKWPCNCTRGSVTVYHLYVLERGRFEMESIFLRRGNQFRGLTLEASESAVLKKLDSLKLVPLWKDERPASIEGPVLGHFCLKHRRALSNLTALQRDTMLAFSPGRCLSR
ncbi:hypothetical protein SAY86_023497 [Trapa natans]|uniref:Uncharacterized protein n=1 Tax=Trapa natans TaxID=22666 RepID=A0AAN7LV13_TRANT|nr:hypothetical protein SAY86_023497 [Trapa natans]